MNSNLIVIRKNIFRALIKEHLLHQKPTMDEEYLEYLTDRYEELEAEFIKEKDND